jgi:hypothetical protein
MISSSTLNELHSHFGLKKDKLTWDGTLDELKAFVKSKLIHDPVAQQTW